MKAARYYGREDIRVEDIPVPDPGPRECLIEVEWAGICGTDLHEYIAGPIGIPTPDRPHPLTGGSIPITLGHEFCGTIKTVPQGSKFRVGQAVMVDPHVPCWECFSCKAGKDHLCHKLAFMGSSGTKGGGGLSEFAAVNERMLHPLPDNVSLEYAAVIEPLVVGLHVTKCAGIQLEGLDVLVIGAGPIGYALFLVLKAQKVCQIIVSEPTAVRRQRASELVDVVVDPRAQNVGDVCRERTDSKGVDIVFDCAGIKAGLDAAFDALIPGGTLVNVAQWEFPIPVPFYPFFLKEVKIHSSCCYNEVDFREVMELIQKGEFKGYERMVTSRIPLDDIVEKGILELINKKDSHLKILITPKNHLVTQVDGS